jgi:Na+:H+ antiporter, NhaA family
VERLLTGRRLRSNPTPGWSAICEAVSAGTTEWTREAARPLQRFLRTEAGSASLLLGATVVALVWANSPWSGAYEDLWSTELSIAVGGAELREDLRHWVNDGLMVFFFFVVGLEIRREMSMGELTERGRAAVPALAALAGMVVPALLYALVTAGGEGARGWGIVMATDIAFVLGLLSLVGPRFPGSLRVFLLTLAIVDDIGAIVVIAIFYSSGIDVVALAVAAALVPAIFVINRVRIWRGPAYLLVGVALWVAMVESGVHPTIAGVLVGVLVAVFPPSRGDVERAARLTRSFRQSPTPELARSATLGVADAVSPNERLQALWHPWTSYVIVPLFALANAGVALDGPMLDRALGSPVTLGVVLGLVVGKLAGISLVAAGAAKLGLGRLPDGVGRGQLAGGAALAGIGFTVSLFITDLAFEEEALREEAKVGVLAASLLAALLATLVFRLAGRGEPAAAAGPDVLDRPVDPRVDHVRGPAGAPLTLVEYGDYQCPFCGRATGVVAELADRFGDDLRYVFRHLPLRDRHPGAQLAAEAAEAAGAQGRFWPMHDRLFALDGELDADALIDAAQALGLDLDRFVDDLQEGVHRAHVDLDVESARRSGVRGTPTFFVDGRRHEGPADAATLADALDAARR